MTERTHRQIAVPEWDLADRLRKAMREADVNVQEMAELLEVSRNTVGSWINGHHQPPASSVRMWAERCPRSLGRTSMHFARNYPSRSFKA